MYLVVYVPHNHAKSPNLSACKLPETAAHLISKEMSREINRSIYPSSCVWVVPETWED